MVVAIFFTRAAVQVAAEEDAEARVAEEGVAAVVGAKS